MVQENHSHTKLYPSISVQPELDLRTNCSPMNIRVFNQNFLEQGRIYEENTAFTYGFSHDSSKISFKRYRDANQSSSVKELLQQVNNIEINVNNILHSIKKSSSSTYTPIYIEEEKSFRLNNELINTDYSCKDCAKITNMLSSDTLNKLINLKTNVGTMLSKEGLSDNKGCESIDKVTCDCDCVGNKFSNMNEQLKDIYALTPNSTTEEEEIDTCKSSLTQVNASAKKVKQIIRLHAYDNNFENARKKVCTKDQLNNQYFPPRNNAIDNVISCKSIIAPTVNNIDINAFIIDFTQLKGISSPSSSSSSLSRTASSVTSLVNTAVEKLRALSAKFDELNTELLEVMEDARTKIENNRECKRAKLNNKQVQILEAPLWSRRLNTCKITNEPEMPSGLSHDLKENLINVNDNRIKISKEIGSHVLENLCRNAYTKSHHYKNWEGNYERLLFVHDEERLDTLFNNTIFENVNTKKEENQGCSVKQKRLHEERSIKESLELRNSKWELEQVLEKYNTVKRMLCSCVTDAEETEITCEYNNAGGKSEQKFLHDNFVIKSFAENMRLSTIAVISKIVKLFGWSLTKMTASELVLTSDNESYNNNNSTLTINLTNGSVINTEHVTKLAKPLEGEVVRSNASDNEEFKGRNFAGDNNSISREDKVVEMEIETQAKSLPVDRSAVNRHEEQVNASSGSFLSFDGKHSDNLKEFENSTLERYSIELEDVVMERELSCTAIQEPEHVLKTDNSFVKNNFFRVTDDIESKNKLLRFEEVSLLNEELQESNCASKPNSEILLEPECNEKENKHTLCDTSIIIKDNVTKQACPESVELNRTNFWSFLREAELHEDTINLESVLNEKKEEEQLMQLQEDENEEHNANCEKMCELQKESLTSHAEYQPLIGESSTPYNEELTEREAREPKGADSSDALSKENLDSSKLTESSLAENVEIENSHAGKGDDKSIHDTSQKLFDENALWEDDGM